MKSSTILSTLLLAGSAIAAPFRPVERAVSFPGGIEKLRGVNIGGWLVLEPWITPSIFEQWPASHGIIDEWNLCKILGREQASSILKQHWDTWATLEDFQRIAAAGFNHVRVPIGFWAYDPSHSPYVTGAAPYMDLAIDWARQTGLQVIIDLHGAPGSQNGFDNSGRKRETPQWEKVGNIAKTLRVLKMMTEKYGAEAYQDVVLGIELLNEPAGFELDLKPIRDFYNKGYKQARAISNTPVIIHDAFQPPKDFNDMLVPGQSSNVIVDHHYYQVFSPEENALSHTQHIQKICGDMEGMAGSNKLTFVGEFSGAMTDCAQYLNGYGVGARYDGTYPDSTKVGSCDGQNDLSAWSRELKTSTRQYIATQILNFETKLGGWTFWNFKTERSPSWDALQLVDAGIFPKLGGYEGVACT